MENTMAANTEGHYPPNDPVPDESPPLSSSESQLTEDQRNALAACEATIQTGIATFLQVGAALQAIRDDRLYRETHPTFETYVRDRWKFSRQRAH